MGSSHRWDPRWKAIDPPCHKWPAPLECPLLGYPNRLRARGCSGQLPLVSLGFAKGIGAKKQSARSRAMGSEAHAHAEPRGFGRFVDQHVRQPMRAAVADQESRLVQDVAQATAGDG